MRLRTTRLGVTSAGRFALPLDRQIAALFASNEQGAWYDIDPAYCYQDAAGTVPAVVGQPVGLVLDRSGRGNHALQATATARPILRQNATTGAHYLEFDGSDDFLATNSINFTSTDKMTVWAGVRKLSDAASGILVELSTGTSLNNDSFYLGVPESTVRRLGLAVNAGGKVTSGITTSDSYIANTLLVLTGRYSSTAAALADARALRANGSEVVLTPTVDGTPTAGNFGNYPLYIGRRGGTTLPFNGHLYGLTIRGAQSTEAQIKLVERYLAKKAGVTLA